MYYGTWFKKNSNCLHVPALGETHRLIVGPLVEAHTLHAVSVGRTRPRAALKNNQPNYLKFLESDNALNY